MGLRIDAAGAATDDGHAVAGQGFCDVAAHVEAIRAGLAGAYDGHAFVRLRQGSLIKEDCRCVARFLQQIGIFFITPGHEAGSVALQVRFLPVPVKAAARCVDGGAQLAA